MGTLAAYSASSAGKLAIARQAPAAAGAAKIQALPVRRLAIPGGPLEEVLTAFTKLTGIPARASADGILSIYSPGISGTYTPRQALEKVCSDAGLEYKFAEGGSVMLSLRTAKTAIEVRGESPVVSSSLSKYQQR